jgi:transcriptional regulator with XRE-family HTH domain
MDQTQYPHMVFYLHKNPDMDIADVIAANIAALIESHPGLDTSKKIAARAGVGFGTIQRARKGDGNITIEKLTAIAGAFGRHPAELMIERPATANIDTNGDYARTIEGSCQRIHDAAVARPVITLPDPRLKEITTLAERIDDAGLARLVGYAQRLAEERPRAARKGNAAR